MTISAAPSRETPETFDFGARERWSTRAAFLAAGVAMSTWAPLVPSAKARLGLDEAGLGLLLLCLGLGSLAAMSVSGALTSRFGCRSVILASSLVALAVLPLLAVAPEVWTMALALAVFGAGVGVLDVAMNVQAVMVEKQSGRHLMSGFHGLYSLGGILGAGGVSLLILQGASPLLCAAGVALAAAAAVFAARGGFLPFGSLEPGAGFVFPRGAVLLIGALCFLVFLAEGSVLDWGALLLMERHGVESGTAGFGFAAFAAAMTLGRLTGDGIVRRFGGLRVLFASGLIAAAGMAVAALGADYWASLFGFLLVGLGASNIVPVLFTAAGRQSAMPPSLAVAAVTTIGYAGVLLGPAAIGFLSREWGLAAVFLGLAALLPLVAFNAKIAASS